MLLLVRGRGRAQIYPNLSRNPSSGPNPPNQVVVDRPPAVERGLLLLRRRRPPLLIPPPRRPGGSGGGISSGAVYSLGDEPPRPRASVLLARRLLLRLVSEVRGG